jgi:hypothetical protein
MIQARYTPGPKAVSLTDPPSEAEFGLTGLTSLETARAAAFCSPHLGNTGPCEVEISFQNSQAGN